MAELLNCPFCGSEPQRDSGWGGHLSCPNLQCPIGGELHDEHTLWFVEAAWNRRTPPPQAAGGEPVAWQVRWFTPSGIKGNWTDVPKREFDDYSESGRPSNEWERRKLFDHPTAIGQEWP